MVAPVMESLMACTSVVAWVREHGWLAGQAVPVPFGAA